LFSGPGCYTSEPFFIAHGFLRNQAIIQALKSFVRLSSLSGGKILAKNQKNLNPTKSNIGHFG